MNIRVANKFDLPYFLHVSKKVRDMTFIPEGITIDDNHLNVMFNTILHGGGIALIAESDVQIGIVVGVINENLWIPNYYSISQILLFVDEEWRHTKVGYKLLQEYNKQVSELLETKRIQMSLIYASEPLEDIDFSRFGYKVSEKIWQLET